MKRLGDLVTWFSLGLVTAAAIWTALTLGRIFAD